MSSTKTASARREEPAAQDWTSVPVRFDADRSEPVRRPRGHGLDASSGLDALDIKILNLLQRDASLSTAEVADRVGLSQSPCWRRIQKLREEGYITGIVALVDPARVGFTLQIFAQLKMSTLSDVERAKFESAVGRIPEILDSWTVFGEMDMMMRILAPDVSWYQDFLFSVLLKLPGVADVRSIVTLGQPKRSTAIPLQSRQFL